MNRWYSKKRMMLSLVVAMIGLCSLPHTLLAKESSDEKLTVVVLGGHPDDPETAAGGLITELTHSGHNVILAYGTAYRGSRECFGRPEAEVRREEGIAACKVLGATPKFFDYAHEDFYADKETLAVVSDWLDEVDPDIVITHWPLDMHPNHHVVSSLVWQCYRREGGWNLYFFEVLTGDQTLGFKPDLYFDISHTRETKKLSFFQHASQNPKIGWELHEKMHRQRGRECGVVFAEAFKLLEPKLGCALLPVEFLPGEAGSWRILD